MISSNKYNYLNEIFEKAKMIHDKYNYPIYDFTNMKKMGINDDLFIDGFHPSEKIVVKILLEIYLRNDTLKKHLNVQRCFNFLMNPFLKNSL